MAWPTEDKPPLKKASSGSRDVYYKFLCSSDNIFRIIGAEHFKFRMLIDTKKYYYVRDRSPKGDIQRS